jgi:GNAT superfamily N-acetyltransferase
MLSFQIVSFRPGQEAGVRDLATAILVDELGACDDLSVHPDLDDIGGSYAEPDSRFLLAMIRGEVVACAAIRRLSDTGCELRHLYVRPSHRREGLASALVMSALAFVKQRGYDTIWLELLPYMQEMTKVYGRYGFLPLPDELSRPRDGEFLVIRL